MQAFLRKLTIFFFLGSLIFKNKKDLSSQVFPDLLERHFYLLQFPGDYRGFFRYPVQNPDQPDTETDRRQNTKQQTQHQWISCYHLTRVQPY
jgi:hypothetical protein